MGRTLPRGRKQAHPGRFLGSGPLQAPEHWLFKTIWQTKMPGPRAEPISGDDQFFEKEKIQSKVQPVTKESGTILHGQVTCAHRPEWISEGEGGTHAACQHRKEPLRAAGKGSGEGEFWEPQKGAWDRPTSGRKRLLTITFKYLHVCLESNMTLNHQPNQ